MIKHERRTNFIYYKDEEPTEQLIANQDAIQSKKKSLPKWLLEFESFEQKNPQTNQSTSSALDIVSDLSTQLDPVGNQRPRTESSAIQRPLWFEQLSTSAAIKQRRHSDEAITNGDSDLLTKLNNSLELSDSSSANCSSSTSSSSEEVSSAFFRKPRKERVTPVIVRDNYELESTSTASKKLVTQNEEADFIIPELPVGQTLIIEVLSNHGDDDFVGLNGVEIFDASSYDHACIEKITHHNSKESIDKLVTKLFDGMLRTHDDSHIWCVPIQLMPIKIKIQFAKPIKVGLIRFWNYNKSRIYSGRGVKDISIKLDSQTIFKGEIGKAYGVLVGSPERFGDTILFTTNEKILEQIAIRDKAFRELISDFN